MEKPLVVKLERLRDQMEVISAAVQLLEIPNKQRTHIVASLDNVCDVIDEVLGDDE